jgi:hypothetical protein
VTSLKTAWKNVRKKAMVKGRWHDNRHTLITELAESGAGDETIMEVAGHVDRQMLRHYSHIRMKAKRVAHIFREASLQPTGNPSQGTQMRSVFNQQPCRGNACEEGGACLLDRSGLARSHEGRAGENRCLLDLS